MYVYCCNVLMTSSLRMWLMLHYILCQFKMTNFLLLSWLILLKNSMALEGLPSGRFHSGYPADTSLLVAMSKNSLSVSWPIKSSLLGDEELQEFLDVLRGVPVWEEEVSSTQSSYQPLCLQNLPGFCFSQGSWSMWPWNPVPGWVAKASQRKAW